MMFHCFLGSGQPECDWWEEKMGLRSGLAVVFSLVGPASVLTSITVLFNFSNPGNRSQDFNLPGNTSQDFNLHVTTIKLGSIR